MRYFVQLFLTIVMVAMLGCSDDSSPPSAPLRPPDPFEGWSPEVRIVDPSEFTSPVAQTNAQGVTVKVDSQQVLEVPGAVVIQATKRFVLYGKGDERILFHPARHRAFEGSTASNFQLNDSFAAVISKPQWNQAVIFDQKARMVSDYASNDPIEIQIGETFARLVSKNHAQLVHKSKRNLGSCQGLGCIVLISRSFAVLQTGDKKDSNLFDAEGEVIYQAKGPQSQFQLSDSYAVLSLAPKHAIVFQTGKGRVFESQKVERIQIVQDRVFVTEAAEKVSTFE